MALTVFGSGTLKGSHMRPEFTAFFKSFINYSYLKAQKKKLVRARKFRKEQVDEIQNLLEDLEGANEDDLKLRGAKNLRALQKALQRYHGYLDWGEDAEEGEKIMKALGLLEGVIGQLKSVPVRTVTRFKKDTLSRQEEEEGDHQVTEARRKGRSLGKSLAPRLGVAKREIKKVHRLLREWIDTYEAAADVPVIMDIPLQDAWESSGDLGTETFANHTPEDLHKILGAAIPFLFAPYYDLQERDHHTAGPSEVNVSTFEEGKNKRRELMWHQLTGLCAIICHFFKSSSDGEVGVDLGTYPGHLVCDGVGLGKTFMMFSVICTVAEEFERQKGDEENGGLDHPPIFENRTVFCGNSKEKIPNLPWIIILPTSLIGQWFKQLKSCMKRGAFDILIYPTKAVDWPLWMTDVFGKSNHPLIRRIVLMSDKTLSRQSRMALDTKGLDPLTRQVPIIKGISETVLKGCVFEYEWNGAFVDEIHMSFRTGGVAYWGLVALWNQTHMKVGATATPLQEGPMDLLYIGRALALPAFQDPDMDDKFKMLQRQTQNLKAIATKHGDDPTALYISHSGSSDDEEIDGDIQEYQDMNKIFAQTMQSAFLPYVIRRTRDSLDWERKKVLEKLSPAEEHIVHVRLPDDELQHIQEDLVVLKENGEQEKQTRMFHLNQRMGLNDPGGAASLATKSPLKKGKKSKRKGRCTKFRSLEEWNTHKGTKLDTVLSTVLWKFSNVEHKEPPLMADGSIDLAAVKGGILPQCDWIKEKAIVFHSFASQTALFQSALKVHGVKTWALNGEISAKEREAILDEFRKYEGTAVLLVTQVGCTGINMAFVRFVFLVDVSWSKQQDEQTIGRVNRPGQTGTVIVYRFLCLDTSDQLMGAGAGVKSDLLREFFKKDNCKEMYKEIFRVEDSNEDIEDEDTIDSDEEARPTSTESPLPDPPMKEARDLRKEKKSKKKVPDSEEAVDDLQAPAVVKETTRKKKVKARPEPSSEDDLPCAPSKVAPSHEKQGHGSNIQHRPEEGKRHPPMVPAEEDAPRTTSDDIIELTSGQDSDGGGSLEYNAMSDDEVEDSLHPVHSSRSQMATVHVDDFGSPISRTVPITLFGNNKAPDPLFDPVFDFNTGDDTPSELSNRPPQLRLAALETAFSHRNRAGKGDPPHPDIVLSSPGDGWTHKPTDRYQQIQAKVKDKAGKTGQGSGNSAAADSSDGTRGVKRKLDELKEKDAQSSKVARRLQALSQQRNNTRRRQEGEDERAGQSEHGPSGSGRPQAFSGRSTYNAMEGAPTINLQRRQSQPRKNK
ncbi:P-loop containing nucleoside triphosphate hydrolase protein [Armillaria solidipes]|uniref:P-loop containing nucleoside triphosphate hydrolase protein n=1 Tax=Armillaria solidipes TaxID=1076256 RepID=A0A2H3AH58_9AGAR|nr:P-loop containing nucleoside triphosphate hydrolase protein [Armillaria solidipes]